MAGADQKPSHTLRALAERVADGVHDSVRLRFTAIANTSHNLIKLRSRGNSKACSSPPNPEVNYTSLLPQPTRKLQKPFSRIEAYI